MTELPCETCHGKRLSREALSVYVGGLNICESSSIFNQSSAQLL